MVFKFAIAAVIAPTLSIRPSTLSRRLSRRPTSLNQDSILQVFTYCYDNSYLCLQLLTKLNYQQLLNNILNEFQNKARISYVSLIQTLLSNLKVVIGNLPKSAPKPSLISCSVI